MMQCVDNLSLEGFHSISFPSEWGPLGELAAALGNDAVSIQLVSPASGDFAAYAAVAKLIGFHSISFPSEWGRESRSAAIVAAIGFHSISFPSEWGR